MSLFADGDILNLNRKIGDLGVKDQVTSEAITTRDPYTLEREAC